MLVMDASVAVNMVWNTETGQDIRKVYLEDGEVYAPSLYVSEVANSLMKYVWAQADTVEGAQQKARAAYELVDKLVAEVSYMPEVLALSAKYKHPAYDMFYLALARRKGAILYTLDKRLADIAFKEGVSCIYPIIYQSE